MNSLNLQETALLLTCSNDCFYKLIALKCVKKIRDFYSRPPKILKRKFVCYLKRQSRLNQVINQFASFIWYCNILLLICIAFATKKEKYFIKKTCPDSAIFISYNHEIIGKFQRQNKIAFFSIKINKRIELASHASTPTKHELSACTWNSCN